MSEAYFDKVLGRLTGYGISFHTDAIANGFAIVDNKKFPLTAMGRIDASNAIAENRLTSLYLRYTAGIPIDQLPCDLDQIVADWERYAMAVRKFNNQSDLWVFDFSDRVQYNQAIQLVGITILLKREDLLSRVAALCDAFKGDDAIYDELLSPYLPDRPSPEKFFHADPYEIVIDAIDEDDPEEQSSLMKEAVERWYPANEGQPFHDTHKQIEDNGSGGYFGYWCFELAALTVILGIDDSSFRDHVTYPKDLADYARPKPAATPEVEPPASAYTGAMAYAGDPCPETGRWQAPRLKNRIEQVETGQSMPGPASTQTGAVVWYLLKA